MRRVFDASVLLAYLFDEPGADRAEKLLVAGGYMSMVNWTESLRKNRLRSVPGRQSPPGDPLAARLGPEPRSEVEHSCSSSEVLSKVAEKGGDPAETSFELAALGILHQSVELLPVVLERVALGAARLRPITRSKGLSLGDRTCLATGRALRMRVCTAERSWRSLRIGVDVELIR